MLTLNFRNIIKKNDNITQLLRYLCVPVWWWNVKGMEAAGKKYLKTNVGKYKDLEVYKNKYSGKRCFIVATGPSLRIGDLDRLYEKKEICFGVNSILTAFNETKWRPDFYGVQDYHGYSKFKNEIDAYTGVKFFGSKIRKYFDNPTGIYFPHCLLNHNYPNQEKIKPILKFSDCAPAVVYDGYSITYSMLELAVYMGFNEIYLLGVDCNYASKTPYFNESSVRGECEIHNSTDLMIMAFAVAKEFCDQKKIKIYNATRGGKLEVFPRINFDDLF